MSDDAAVNALRRDWPRLTSVQRGERLLPLARHFSTRQLACRLGRSAKLIRDLLELARLTPAQLAAAGCGRKKLLTLVRRSRAAVGRSQHFRHGKVRRQLAQQLANTLEGWLRSEMPPAFMEPFFDEILTWPSSREEFHGHLPRWQECHVAGDWEKIIAETRPGKPPGQWDSLLGFWRRWLALWYPRCMPIGAIRERVLLRVRRKLREGTPQLWWKE